MLRQILVFFFYVKIKRPVYAKSYKRNLYASRFQRCCLANNWELGYSKLEV